VSESAADLLDNATDYRYVTIGNSTHQLSYTPEAAADPMPGTRRRQDH
jgi:hypothetical protein